MPQVSARVADLLDFLLGRVGIWQCRMLSHLLSSLYAGRYRDRDRKDRQKSMFLIQRPEPDKTVRQATVFQRIITRNHPARNDVETASHMFQRHAESPSLGDYLLLPAEPYWTGLPRASNIMLQTPEAKLKASSLPVARHCIRR